MALEEAGVQLIADGVSQYVSGMKKVDDANAGFTKSVDAAVKASESLGDAAMKAAGLTQDAAGRWRTTSGRFASDAEKAAAGIATVGTSAEETGRGVERSGKHFNAFQEVITGALRHVGVALVEFAAQGVKAIGGFVKDSIGLAGDFESGMLDFQSVAGKDVDVSGLEEFRDLFLDIGARLPVSTSDVQQAAIEMVKGGIDPAIIAAGGLERNIQFAAAAMDGDLVKAAEISSKVLGGWTDANASAADKTAFLTSATDLLTKAANASATDVEGLSLGIFNSQGIAKTAGVEFADLTTTLALLAPRFASSSEAGNSLKNVIARLQPTTDPATQAMESLGLWTQETGSAFYDASGNFVGFEKASALLKESLAGLTKEQQASLLQTIFGNDAMGAAAALADGGGEAYRAMAEALAGANGVLDTAALKQQGFNTSLDNAKGSVETLQIRIGTVLLPILGDLLDNYITPGINALTEFAAALFGDEDAFNKLTPTMQAFITVIDAVIEGFSEGGLLGALEQLVPEFTDVISIFKQGGAASDTLGNAIEDLSGVWTLALTVVQNVASGYKAIFDAVLPIVQSLIDEHGTEIEGFFKGTWDSIIQIVTLALELYNAIVPPILKAIAGFISDHSEEITKILNGAWDIITALITGTLDTIKGVFKTALALINGDWEGAWNGIKGILDTQATAIQKVISGFLDIIAGLFNTSMADIAQTWEDNWNMLVNIATQTDWAQVGQNVVDGIKQGLIDSWDSLTGWLSDKADDLVNAALDAIGAHSPATAFMPVGQYIIMGIMEGMNQKIPALMDQVQSLGDDLSSTMRGIAEDIQGVIADAFSATASIDRQIASNLDKLKDVLPAYQQYTEGALKAAEAEARQFADPAQGAKYFALRSKQILEYAKLQKDLSEAETKEDKDRIAAQMLLINAAQTAELNAFNAAQVGQQSPTQELADKIKSILDGIGPVLRDDPRAPLVDLLQALWAQAQRGVAGRASGGPVKKDQPYWVGEQGPELFFPNAAGRIMDSLASRQSQLMGAGAMAQASSNTTIGHQGAVINMPIYTSQSPAVLRDSLAIAGAALL